MTRPSVLLVESDDTRRRALALGLARFAYEVIPASTAQQGLHFAAGLGPSVVVADAALEGFRDGSVLASFSARSGHMARTLVLLGSGQAPADDLPEETVYLDTRGRTEDEIVRRLRLILVGREVGLEADFAVRTLLGDLAMVPLLEVMRSVHHAGVSGTLAVDTDGAICLEKGLVTSARAGAARGVKAVCRLARRDAGALRLTLGSSGGDREITLSFDDLMVRTIEDVQVPLPDLLARLELVDATAAAESESDPVLLAAVADGTTVAHLLDALPRSDGQVALRIERLVERGVLVVRRPLPRTAVVVDSTGDLPGPLVAAHDLHVVPLAVRFANERLLDGIEIRPRAFYERIADEHPTTEPPSHQELSALYERLLPEQDVVSVHLSAAMSETFSHAVQAAEESRERAARNRPDPRVELVDGGSVSLGIGLLALFGARMAARDHDAGAIATQLRGCRDRIQTLFLVDTFDYLVRGGRIGRARAALGRLLGIKPILGVVNGEVAAIDRVRGGRRAHPRMVELVAERVDVERPLVLAIAHAAAPVWADRLKTLFAERFELAEVVLSDIGPVVGAHTGPGCVGCAAFQPTDKEWAEIQPLAD